MNRPFPAFATLLFILTLTVIAVSANSRSPSGGPAPPRPTPRTTSKAIGGPSFVLVFPESAEDFCQTDQWHWIMVGKTQTRLDALRVSNGRQTSPLKSVSLDIAGPVGGTSAGAFMMDCRSYYDPTYDLIVYGSLGPKSPVSNASRQAFAVSGDEMVAIFEGLGACRGTRSGQASTERLPPQPTTLWRQARIASAAARQWLTYQIRRLAAELPLVGQWPGRVEDGLSSSEYAEFREFAGQDGE